MSQSEAWTVGRLLQWTADFLKQKGSPSPRLDAEVLLAEARGCQRIELYTAFHETPPEEIRNRFRELVKRRAEGTPVAYLVGRREFYSLDFRVSPEVLIPRPETELVVVTVLDLIKSRPDWSDPLEVADVGTGSGIIAICVARHAPSARVLAVDISAAALRIAAENVQTHALADRVQLHEGDLLSFLPPEPRFHIIASNPPYVSDAEMTSTAAEAARHEPALALRGGSTGAEIVGRLLREAGERLLPGGWLVMEISPTIESRVRALLATEPRLTAATFLKDLAGLTRVVKLQRADGPEAH